MSATIVVSQLGARMHYAVPRILASQKSLGHFYTDICATKGWPKFVSRIPSSLLPAALRRLVGRRVPAEVPCELMTVFPTFGLRSGVRRLRVTNTSEETSHAIWAGTTFSRLVSRSGFHGAVGLYAFSGDALEQMRAARRQGMWTAVEQMIAPRDVLEELMLAERQRFPQWEGAALRDPLDKIFAARERAEWRLADRIICPSDFVAGHVIAGGTPCEKCIVVPYGVDPTFQRDTGIRKPGPLRVLVVGAVGLRKGSPYILEAASRLKGSAVFRMAGATKLSASVRSDLARHIELRGIVPRAGIHDEYRWADVFLLPSLCEGSATVVYEALAAGLPVITTENTGSVVRHGVEGLVVPIRDGEAIAAAIDLMASNDALRRMMGENAVERARAFTVARYGERLLAALSNLPPERSKTAT
ncbi:glycosyltransferase family 4 protein [Rhizobium sp. Root482]|uniref:glycosyltransferase family 4 protein n=1 Tax=Rhizobium sp. Root482 TaxID=1736543 RepID=UPI0006FA5BE6|nr:glycosyltransferase family 4 protein [Rhizobium sp. Root482]KQY26675.1 glycoside hydrolase [Rhizobium sp. Root482]